MPRRKRIERGSEGKDGSLTEKEEALNCRLQEMKVNVDERCEKILNEARHSIESLENAKLTFLLGLPERIRKMPLKEFCTQFGGKLENVLEAGLAAVRKSIPGGTTVSQLDGLTTPSGKRPNPYGPTQTPVLRRAREGEWVLSQNGSPLGRIGGGGKDSIDPRWIKPASPSSIPQTPTTQKPKESISDMFAKLELLKEQAAGKKNTTVSQEEIDAKIETLHAELQRLAAVLNED